MKAKDPVRFVDERLGGGDLARKLLRYVFPDHWSFMLGEIALYAFVVLVGTGIFLACFYNADDHVVTYTGTYAPLIGREMGAQYKSVIDIIFDVPAGNLMRQTHHWAADVFVMAIVLHLIRIISTGAFRKPRELNYLVGVTMLGIALLEGFLGYSLIDDLLSGMGLVIAYAVLVSIPVIGADIAFLFWGGEYPGSSSLWPRMELLHILILPMAIAALIGLHLAMIMRQHHTQFRGGPKDRRSELEVVGTPMWPGYALRSMGLFLLVAGFLVLLGGLIQINPVWEWGPYHTYLSTNGAQPDYYLGWLIGGLRLMPPLELHLFGYTIVPNPFWGGALFPTLVFGILYAWPWLDKRFWGDRRKHHVLDRPRDNPRRTAALAALATWVFFVFIAGGTDRFYFRSTISYEAELWFFRAFCVFGPIIAYFATKRICQDLQRRGGHPLRRWSGTIVRRTDVGGHTPLGGGPDDAAGVPRDEAETPVGGPAERSGD